MHNILMMVVRLNLGLLVAPLIMARFRSVEAV